jgi:hypothetical protein
MGLLESGCKTVGLPADRLKEKFFMAVDILSLAPAGKYLHPSSLFQHTRAYSVLGYMI